MICQCGGQALNGDVFCRKCGIELPQVEYFLCDCGAEVLFDDSFCHACGVKFDGIQDLEEVYAQELQKLTQHELCGSCGQEL